MEPNVDPSVLYHAVMDFDQWTQQIVPIALPTMMQLIMGDVCGGSSSTSMVSRHRVKNGCKFYFYDTNIVVFMI